MWKVLTEELEKRNKENILDNKEEFEDATLLSWKMDDGAIS